MKPIQLLALLLVSPLLSAANWPQFRGPNSQGHSPETGLPLTWDATNHVLWQTPLPGDGWSSPIVWNRHLFVTACTDNGEACHVLALDRIDCHPLWNREVFRQVPRHKENRNGYATPTPATDGRRVYACFGDGSFVALDFTGAILWTNRSHPFYSQHGMGTSPILHEGLLIMARDGSSDGEDKAMGWTKTWDQARILALDTATGRERWIARRGHSRIAHGVPAIWKPAGGPAQLVSEAGDVVQGFDLRTGERLWSSEVIGEGKVPSTVLGDGLVFTAGGYSGRESIKAFRLGGRGDLGTTNQVWEQRKGMPKVPSLLYLKPHLYAVTDGGVASCLNAATGDLVWQERLGGNFSASPVAADNRIYFLSDEGETIVLAPGAEFKVLARNPLKERVQASMAVAYQRLYFRTATRLICIGAP